MRPRTHAGCSAAEPALRRPADLVNRSAACQGDSPGAGNLRGPPPPACFVTARYKTPPGRGARPGPRHRGHRAPGDPQRVGFDPGPAGDACPGQRWRQRAAAAVKCFPRDPRARSCRAPVTVAQRRATRLRNRRRFRAAPRPRARLTRGEGR